MLELKISVTMSHWILTEKHLTSSCYNVNTGLLLAHTCYLQTSGVHQIALIFHLGLKFYKLSGFGQIREFSISISVIGP